MTGSREKVEDIVVVPKKSELMLNSRQLEDYRMFRKSMIKWVCNLGKNPDKAEGYAYDTARQRLYKIDQFYRWIWQQEDGYTLNATTDHADEYSKELAYEETSQTHKAAVQKAVKTLFKYLRNEKNRSIEWDPQIQFTNGGSQTHQVRDFLTDSERKKIKQAVLEYGSIPHHHDDSCNYEPDLSDPMTDHSFRRRFNDACDRADIPDNKQRPYNLRHTSLTEVATFMGYEQLNKFAGWVPGSDRAKVYVHLNNDDVNQAIRDEYGLSTENDEDQSQSCPFCGTENQSQHSECRNCGRPLSLEGETQKDEKQKVLERLTELALG